MESMELTKPLEKQLDHWDLADPSWKSSMLNRFQLLAVWQDQSESLKEKGAGATACDRNRMLLLACKQRREFS